MPLYRCHFSNIISLPFPNTHTLHTPPRWHEASRWLINEETGKSPKKLHKGQASMHMGRESKQNQKQNNWRTESKTKQNKNKQTTKSVNEKHKLNTKASSFWLFSYLMSGVTFSDDCILCNNYLWLVYFPWISYILQHLSGRQAGVVQWLGWLPSFQLAKVWFWLTCSIEKSHCYFSLVRNPFIKPPMSPASLKC